MIDAPDQTGIDDLPADVLDLLQRGMAQYRSDPAAAEFLFGIARSMAPASLPLYSERFGPPFLRRRHMPFAIGVGERDQWMACMLRAMQDVGLAADLRTQLEQAFFKTADFMRNQPE